MKYLILEIDSYDGNSTARIQADNGKRADSLFAVIKVEGTKADIVDDGYSSKAQAFEAWKDKLAI